MTKNLTPKKRSENQRPARDEQGKKDYSAAARSLASYKKKIHPLTATPRGEQYADVYAFTPGNRAYLRGLKSKPDVHMPYSSYWLFIFVIFTPILLCFCAQASYFESNSGMTNCFYVMIGLLVAYWVFTAFFKWYRNNWFIDNGQLLFGSIVFFEGEWLYGTTKPTGFFSMPVPTMYRAFITYAVVTPSGESIINKEMREFSVMEKLPKDGDRIAVLYVADGDQMRML